MKADYYEVLGVDRASDSDVIKKAYRKLAMQHHPDKNPGDKTSENKFKQAAEAYEVLSNPDKKANYDRFGHAGAGMGGFSSGFQDVGDIFDSFGDIFGDFFGGGGRRRTRDKNAPRRGSDLKYYLEIDLIDVLNGVTTEITYDTEDDCNKCSGSGAKEGSQPTTCSTCGGSGQVIRSQGFFQVAATCSSCAGAGTIIKDKCSSCHGKGRGSESRVKSVTVPAGVDSGTQLRVTGEGDSGYKGGPKGDLYVELGVKPDKCFQRQGQHLVSPLSISYLQALLGSEVSVEGLEGAEELCIKKGTKDGELIHLKEKGLPSLRNSRRGDHIFEVTIDIPKKLAKKEEELLREIAQLKGDQVSEKKGFFS